MRSPSSSSVTATSPPSPSANRFFVGKKLNVEAIPVVPTPAAPNACAASSTIGTPRRAFGPRMKTPASRTSARRSFSSGRRGAYCALTSTSGIGRTASESSRAPARDYPRRGRHDSHHDRVIDEAEVVVEALPALPDGPADAREREAPDRGAEERQEDVRHEPHPEHASGDRDERGDDRRDPAEADGPVAPAGGPPLRAAEVLRREVEEPAVTLEQRAAAVRTDRPARDRADEVADRPRERHREKRPDGRRDRRAEERDVRRGERARRERPRVHHHQLAGRREDGVDRHQR